MSEPRGAVMDPSEETVVGAAGKGDPAGGTRSPPEADRVDGTIKFTPVGILDTLRTMSEEEFEEFDAEGLGIDPELLLRFRFGVVGEDRGVHPPFIPLIFSFERPGQSFRGHVRYGRFWEKDEEPTEADRQMLMDWAKARLASDLDTELAKENPPAFSERYFMPRGS